MASCGSMSAIRARDSAPPSPSRRRGAWGDGGSSSPSASQIAGGSIARVGGPLCGWRARSTRPDATNPVRAALARGRLVDEIDLPGDTRHLQHLVDWVRASHHDEASPRGTYALVGHDHRAQTGRVDEREGPQVEDDGRRPGSPVRHEEALEPIDAGHVELPRQAHLAYPAALRDGDLEQVSGVRAFRGGHLTAGEKRPPLTHRRVRPTPGSLGARAGSRTSRGLERSSKNWRYRPSCSAPIQRSWNPLRTSRWPN